jgi:flagellar biosynthesis/type III secretory pathway chaperone
MSRRAAAETRQGLQKVLSDSIRCALSLKEILVDEKQALQQRDTVALGENSGLKESCIKKLAALELARGEISRDAGFAAGLNDMPALTQWCDQGDVIAGDWRQFMQIARQCDALNATNGAIIRIRRQQILAGLSLLRGTDANAETYGISGSGTTGFGGRELAEV